MWVDVEWESILEDVHLWTDRCKRRNRSALL